MSYIVMARKWRPQTFDTVVGQEHVVRTLKNALAANRLSHAYLFTGPRGVGKTTTARLLAKAVNCLQPKDGEPCNVCARCVEIGSGASTDVLEIDGASNGLVDDARELREKVKYAPAACRNKVLIIDEVHMMSQAAFNALLKTLEEPPANTIFILATTEAHKVPATIISRCQRFDFRRIPVKEIVARLDAMARAENLEAEAEALHVVARAADGSLRDAQSLLDQIVNYSGTRITAADAASVLGLAGFQRLVELTEAVALQDAPRALRLITDVVSLGVDLRQFMKDWVEYWRALVMVRVVPADRLDFLDLSGPALAEAQRQAQAFSPEDLIGIARQAAASDEELRRTQHPRTVLELLVVGLCQASRAVSLESLWRSLTDLEQRIASRPRVAVEPAAAAPDPAPDEAPAPAAEKDAGEPVLAVDSLEEAPPATVLEQVAAAWPEVMQALAPLNRRVHALLKDVTPTSADAGWVELTCASPYHLAGLEMDETRKLIESQLAAVLKRPVRLRLKVAASAAAGVKEAVTEKPLDPEAIIRQEPLVQKALELFGGKIVEIIPKPGTGGKK